MDCGGLRSERGGEPPDDEDHPPPRCLLPWTTGQPHDHLRVPQTGIHAIGQFVMLN